jgi:hypothetical protein
MRTPVAFIIFNRPDTTARVFESIRHARPPKLLVIADGARPDKIGEAEKCAATRAVIDRVDWDCEVMTNYSDINLGCRSRVASGIDWVFQQVEEAIILEDDCLPEPSFFPYCEELLERYRHDTRMMTISGDNFQFGRRRTSDSYYFSQFNYMCPTWGWATWRRAWQYYDVNIELWATIRDEGWLEDILGDSPTLEVWKRKFQSVYDREFDTWDYQWIFTCWVQNGSIVIPNVNLISNIGYRADATHSKTLMSEFANMPVVPMPFPLQHPKFVIRDTKADRYANGSSNRLDRLRGILTNPTRLKQIVNNYQQAQR